MYLEGGTFDDLLRKSLTALLDHGSHIKPGKGNALEIIGLTLRLTNPLARFSRTESRGVLFSALGETLWYFSGSDDFNAVEHYIPTYRDRCATPLHVDRSEAAYGPRWQAQMPFLIGAIKRDYTRRAVLSIYRQSDQKNEYEALCTCTIQFLPRSGVLHASTYMRSNDAYTGLAHDIFAFTLLQEYLARTAGLQVGQYTHQVGSFHLYEENYASAKRYIAGGYSDDIPMEPMPQEDPQAGLGWLLQTELALRTGASPPDATGIDDYWQDLAILLRARPLRKSGQVNELRGLLAALKSQSFRTFIQDEISRV